MIEYLGKKIKVKMDRPLGSKHPEYDLIYPINYGYIEGTISGDGEEIDAYVLGEFEPLDEYEGVVIAVIKRSNDNEDKLVVAKKMNKYSKKQIAALTEFQERFYKSEIIMSKKNNTKLSLYISIFGVLISIILVSVQALTPLPMTTGIVIILCNLAIFFNNLSRYRQETQ
jgi:inorganic pyrophosphatase